MLTDLYIRKKIGIPFISLLLIISALLVTIPSYLNPIWYDVFGGTKHPIYFWQNFTHHLEHGHPIPGQLHALIHLAVNLLVIATCGFLTERTLGTTKLFGLTLLTIILSIPYKFYGIVGNGASGIVWAYSSVAFYIMVLLYRRNKEELMRDPLFYLFGVILFVIWIAITIINYLMEWHTTNVLHLISILIGAFTAYWFKDDISNKIDRVLSPDTVTIAAGMWDKRVIAIFSLVPILIIGIYGLSYTGVLNKHISTPITTEIFPVSSSPASAINDADGKIVIRFYQNMRQHIDSISVDISSTASSSELRSELVWVNSKTLEIIFNRPIEKGDSINIYLKGFYCETGQLIRGYVHLDYNY